MKLVEIENVNGLRKLADSEGRVWERRTNYSKYRMTDEVVELDYEQRFAVMEFPEIRHTPLLDRCGIVFTKMIPAHVVNVIDAALRAVEARIDWGEHEGKKRKPCDGQPLLLAGQPIGQYHCECCLEMQIAGCPHLPPDDEYEKMVGRPWPTGYVETD